ADSDEERNKALENLRKVQTQDFYELLKIMDGYPVNIRLLDAPLHEFLPTTRESMAEFVKIASKENNSLTGAKIRSRSQMLREFNPMLGHRGVRIAISFPEIYRMQVRAIFEAAYKLKSEGVQAKPEIMVPLVMTASEIKVVRNGKRIEGKQILGIRDIEEEIRTKFNSDPIDYKVGTMIELPAAALQAGDIARYADFFSFGTNDLTQTTTGISRDDFNTFFSDYNEFDLLPSNPFKVLEPQVKEMVEIAAIRGRMTRPDLTLGICGEHGAEPSNVAFFRGAGLDYVSVSPYGIPIAKLAIAQMNLADGQG
ncbi:MAG: putative PEP-binding protein, partial [Spirochaetaceae bacterium]